MKVYSNYCTLGVRKERSPADDYGKIIPLSYAYGSAQVVIQHWDYSILKIYDFLGSCNFNSGGFPDHTTFFALFGSGISTDDIHDKKFPLSDAQLSEVIQKLAPEPGDTDPFTSTFKHYFALIKEGHFWEDQDKPLEEKIRLLAKRYKEAIDTYATTYKHKINLRVHERAIAILADPIKIGAILRRPVGEPWQTLNDAAHFHDELFMPVFYDMGFLSASINRHFGKKDGLFEGEKHLLKEMKDVILHPGKRVNQILEDIYRFSPLSPFVVNQGDAAIPEEDRWDLVKELDRFVEERVSTKESLATRVTEGERAEGGGGGGGGENNGQGGGRNSGKEVARVGGSGGVTPGQDKYKADAAGSQSQHKVGKADDFNPALGKEEERH